MNTYFDTPIIEDNKLIRMARATLRKSYFKNNRPAIHTSERIVKCVGWRCEKTMLKSEARQVQYNCGKVRNLCPSCYAKFKLHEIAKGSDCR